ncbi:hypothetical protein LCGC14_0890830 [marine sediment metagenome]|uniref:Uncharacterized protein n=1 Tax=marine sediment metagenome TaxID=412755 RepID=A0A0F9S6B2_9ZZZZ
MIQKWYNRILLTSLLTLVLGMLFVFPVLYQFEIGKMILNTVGLIIPVSGCAAILLIFGDIFFGYRHFSGWINQHNKLIDRSG